MKTETRIKIRGYHLDVYAHVNNARYLEFLEEGRWQYLDEGSSFEKFEQSGLGFSVVNINISYLRPAVLGDTVVVETTLKSMGRKSAVMHQVVRLEKSGEISADADVTFVLVSSKTRRAVEFSGELLDQVGLTHTDDQ